MKVHIETAVPRRKFVVGDSYEARKTASGHSCETLVRIKVFRNQILYEKSSLYIASIESVLHRSSTALHYIFPFRLYVDECWKCGILCCGS